MRDIDLIGNDADHVEYRSNKPEYAPCPRCGIPGKRKGVKTRRVRHVAMLYLPSWIVAEAGVYEARCECCKDFQAPVPGVPHRGQYAYEVRNRVANALIRDRMPYHAVILQMHEEHRLSLSLGYIHHCFVWPMSRSTWKATGPLYIDR